MNKKIILSLGAAALLTSSLFAYGPQGSMKKGCKQGTNQQQMMMKKGNHGKKDAKMMRMIMMLDLTDKQRVQIQGIMANSKKNMPNPHDAFTQSTFDKEMFIKLAKQKKYGVIERKADLVEKIYKVINSSQKQDLKTILNMKDMKQKRIMTKGDCNGKNCNGRR
ncbi:MAG: hypothetical protein KAQ94_00295 [Arcobacteraceae bacterium]|nr:hypothetical protein [Arcobacteraceae bacterium]